MNILLAKFWIISLVTSNLFSILRLELLIFKIASELPIRQCKKGNMLKYYYWKGVSGNGKGKTLWWTLTLAFDKRKKKKKRPVFPQRDARKSNRAVVGVTCLLLRLGRQPGRFPLGSRAKGEQQRFNHSTHDTVTGIPIANVELRAQQKGTYKADLRSYGSVLW